MAISREKKQSLVSELSELLGNAKMTVFAHYDGLTVAELQEMRRAAREAGVTIKVVKNRLVRVAMQEVKHLKHTDATQLQGQLLYALSTEDEVAPAQALAKFAKVHQSLRLAGGFDASGTAFDEAAVKQLAALPTKEQLRGQLAGVIAGPLTGMASVLSGNLRSVLYALNARVEQLEKA